MRKLIVTLIGLLTVVLLVCGCGAEKVDWDDFFNEYYGECIAACERCIFIANMCNLDFSVEACVLGRWSYGSSPTECRLSVENHINRIIETKDCNDTEYIIAHCMYFSNNH